MSVDYLREIVALRERNELLEEENRQLREQLVPPVTFPVAWRLDPQMTRILARLVAANGSIVTHDRMASSLWDDPEDVPEGPRNTITVRITKMRQRLAPHGIGVQTVWGVGYRLDPASLARVRAALAPEGGQ